MKTKHTLIALAVSALFAAPAFASGQNDGPPRHDPCPTCDVATASVHDGQEVKYLDVSNDRTDNKAIVKDNFMQNASGNIGVNEAAGGNNQQANAAAIASADGKFCFRAPEADASAYANQSSYRNDVENTGSANLAIMKDNAMQNVSGNVGLNIAAGDGNQQKNDLAIAVVSGSGVADASTGAHQSSHGNDIDNDLARSYCRTINSTNTALLKDNAMQNAKGNIGVNMAAGSFNQQFNGLTVASANKP